MLRGPVFITDRGQPAHASLNGTDFHKLAGAKPSIVRQLVMRGGGAVAFDPPRLRDGLRTGV